MSQLSGDMNQLFSMLQFHRPERVAQRVKLRPVQIHHYSSAHLHPRFRTRAFNCLC